MSAKQKRYFERVPFVTIYPHQIVRWTKFQEVSKDGFAYPAGYSNYHDITKENNKRTTELSVVTQKKIRRAIQILIHTSKRHMTYCKTTKNNHQTIINFITLTLPSKQSHSDSEIKRVALQSWLNIARKKFGLKDYVWVAETQANGNIHFHITTNVFIHHKKIRDSWNWSINRLGYVNRFKEKNGHYNPNSTDVHCVKNIRNLAAYLVKYMSKKNEGRRVVEGKAFGISNSITEAKHTTFLTPDIRNKMEGLLRKNKHRFYEASYCELYTFSKINCIESLIPAGKGATNPTL